MMELGGHFLSSCLWPSSWLFYFFPRPRISHSKRLRNILNRDISLRCPASGRGQCHHQYLFWPQIAGMSSRDRTILYVGCSWSKLTFTYLVVPLYMCKKHCSCVWIRHWVCMLLSLNYFCNIIIIIIVHIILIIILTNLCAVVFTLYV